MATQQRTTNLYYCVFPVFKDSEFELPDNLEYLVEKTKENSDARGYSYTKEEIQEEIIEFIEYGMITRVKGKMLFKYRN